MMRGAPRSLTIEETHNHYFPARTPRLLKLRCYIDATAR
jgi:hypothetical protein